ncbi:TniB family NTP-binding protein [Psychromonas sp. GE-S-Ul-11]|uniref:TniB family NTP-binding protein n=1 Tax=Psychromonas sp. GE-S-Ul-11 TaxID=3241170 RepID=UPI00390C4EE7
MNELTESQLEQLRIFGDCIVIHPQIQVILNDFDELRLNRKFQSDQQCMLLTGDTGVGKTHIIKHYKKRVLATQNYSRGTMPILVSRISNGKGLDATLIQILIDLELFGSSQRKKRGYQTDLTGKVIKSLIRAKVELLILNEFQELLEFKNFRDRQDVANTLKRISEEAKVPIVLVGMPWADKIAEEPQWSSRLFRRRKLEYFNLLKDHKYYREYLMGLAKHMPFNEPPKLGGKHTAVALFAVCRGENRKLKHFLIESLKLALSYGEFLETKHFIEAYDKLYLLKQKVSSDKSADKKNKKNSADIENNNDPVKTMNPFEQNVEDIEISQVIQHSKYNPNAMDPEDMLTERIFSQSKTLAQLLSK